ncbi:MAG: hypothetical protein Q9163_001606 [Psora crenata]
MAPMGIYELHPLKRTASAAQLNSPAPKRLQRRHHKAAWDVQRDQRCDASLQDEETANTLLTRSICLALEAVGFEGVRPGALESFRLDVEECTIHPLSLRSSVLLIVLDMAHFLSSVRQSMLSCRRVQAIPQDFLQALHTHQLSLRSLLPHLDPPVLPSKSQFPLQVDSSEENEFRQYRPISTLFKEVSGVEAHSYIPKHFPDFPDKHTYQATPVYKSREQDARKIRERATEEGRLGEEALRKLVTAGISPSTEPARPKSAKLSLRAKRDQMWKETISAVVKEGHDSGGEIMDVEKAKRKEGDDAASKSMQGHLSLAVNAEKRYWRKPAR